MKDKQKDVITGEKKRKYRRKEIKSALEKLFQREPEYDTQGQIISDLKTMGIEATQATLSRALRELSIENTSGKWRKSEKVESLMELEKMFGYCGGSARWPRLYSKVDVVILQTKPNFNTVLAQQITEAFKNEVLCTICPDDKHVIIYYKLTEKEKPDEETEKAKSIYKKSKMRVELVKLCKKYRKGKKKEDETEEE